MLNYRETRAGDMNDLQREVKDLNTQLRDRKHANVLLNTENQRLKRQLFDLQQRLADIEVGREGKKGEASSASALRVMAAREKQKALASNANFSQAMDENQALIDQLSDMAQQLAASQASLAAAQDGWKVARDEVASLQESTDNLEMERRALDDQLQLVQQKLEATEKALADEQGARSRAEGLAAQVDGEKAKQREEHSNKLTSELAALRDSMQKAADAAVAAKQAELDAKDATLQALNARMAQHQQMTSSATPPGLTVRARALLPSSATAASAGTAATMTAAGTASAAAPVAVAPSAANTATATPSPWSNAMEIIAHDVTFTTSQANLALYDLWAVLVLSAPAIGIRNQRVLVAAEPHAEPVPVNLVYCLGMGASIRDELALLSSSTVQWSLYNLKGAVVGGFRCPAPAGHPLAGQIVPVVACGLQHAAGVTCIELYVFDKASAEPKDSLAMLSADWQTVLPTGATPPKPSEFVVDLRAHDPLMLEGARMCGIFLPGRTFTGSDTRTYQVWGLQEIRPRQLATNKYLEAEVAVVEDLGLGSQPFATTTLPLSVGLTAPSKTKLEAQLLKAAVLQPPPPPVLSAPVPSQPAAAQPRVPQATAGAAPPQQPPAAPGLQVAHSKGAYDMAPEHGTRTLTLRTPLDIPVASLQLTVRLLEDVPVGELLTSVAAAPPLATPADAGAPGVPVDGSAMAAPPLPALHWASSMAAEEVAAGKMLRALRDRVAGSCTRILSGLASSPGELDECQQLMMQTVDSIRAHSEQLEGSVGSCHGIASRVPATAPAETELAAGMAKDVEAMVCRALGQLLLDVHQQHEQAALGAGLWGMACAPGPAASPAVLPTSQQLKMAASLETALAGAVEKRLAATLAAIRPQAVPAVLAMAAAAAVRAHGTTAPPSPPLPLADVVTKAITSLTDAVDLAATASTQVYDTCRQHLTSPPAGISGDEYELVGSAQQEASSVLTRVTAALAQGLSGLGPSLAADLLMEPGTPGTLADLLAPSATATTGAAAGGVAQQLGRTLVQLNTVLTRILTADPSALPPAGPQVAAQWLRASHKLQGQLYTACGFWTAMAVASLGRSLAALGQRPAAVMLALEALGTCAVQVVQMAQAALSKFRVTKAYEESVVDAGLPTLTKLLELHVTSACSLAFNVATQLLLLPLLRRPHVVWGHEAWVGPPMELAVGGVHELMPVSLHTLQQLAPLPRADTPGEPAAPGAAVAPATTTAVSGGEGGAEKLPVLAGVLRQWQPQRLLLLISSPAGGRRAQEQVQALTLAASVLGFTTSTLEQVVADPQYAGMADREKVVAAGGAADAAILLMPEQEAGSAPKWLASGGLLMLKPEQDSDLQQAVSHVVEAAVNPAHESVGALARLLVSRLGKHLMGRLSAAVQAVSGAPLAAQGSGGLGSAQLLTYLDEGVGVVKPLLTASQAIQKKLADAVEQLTSSFSTAPANLQGCATSIGKAALVVVAGQQTLFEGLLLAAQPLSMPPPSLFVAQSAGDTTAAQRTALPLFVRQSPPRTQGAAPPGPVPPTAEALATLAGPAAPAVAGDGASTASEDAEPFVIKPPARPVDLESELESEFSAV